MLLVLSRKRRFPLRGRARGSPVAEVSGADPVRADHQVDPLGGGAGGGEERGPWLLEDQLHPLLLAPQLEEAEDTGHTLIKP